MGWRRAWFGFQVLGRLRPPFDSEIRLYNSNTAYTLLPAVGYWPRSSIQRSDRLIHGEASGVERQDGRHGGPELLLVVVLGQVQLIEASVRTDERAAPV